MKKKSPYDAADVAEFTSDLEELADAEEDAAETLKILVRLLQHKNVPDKVIFERLYSVLANRWFRRVIDNGCVVKNPVEEFIRRYNFLRVVPRDNLTVIRLQHFYDALLGAPIRTPTVQLVETTSKRSVNSESGISVKRTKRTEKIKKKRTVRVKTRPEVIPETVQDEALEELEKNLEEQLELEEEILPKKPVQKKLPIIRKIHRAKLREQPETTLSEEFKRLGLSEPEIIVEPKAYVEIDEVDLMVAKEKSAKEYIQPRRDVGTVNEIYYSSPVTDSLRNFLKKRILRILAPLFPTEEVEKSRTVIETNPTSYEFFVDQEFVKWFNNTVKIDMIKNYMEQSEQNLNATVDAALANLATPYRYFNEYIVKFNPQLFTPSSTSESIVKYLLQKNERSKVETDILLALLKFKENLVGKLLLDVLENVVRENFARLTREEIYKSIRNERVRELEQSIIPELSQFNEFVYMNQKELQHGYTVYRDAFERSRKKAVEKEIVAASSSEKLQSFVDAYENASFLSYGKMNSYCYTQSVLFPFVFCDQRNNVGYYCNTIRSFISRIVESMEIGNDDKNTVTVSISGLEPTNVAFLFTEYEEAKSKLSANRILVVEDEIAMNILFYTVSTLREFDFFKDPTMRRKDPPPPERVDISFIVNA